MPLGKSRGGWGTEKAAFWLQYAIGEKSALLWVQLEGQKGLQKSASLWLPLERERVHK